MIPSPLSHSLPPSCDSVFPCRDREISVPEVRSKDHTSCCADHRHWQHQRRPHRHCCQGQVLPSDTSSSALSDKFHAELFPNRSWQKVWYQNLKNLQREGVYIQCYTANTGTLVEGMIMHVHMHAHTCTHARTQMSMNRTVTTDLQSVPQ